MAELLAPAGSFENMLTAIDAGADAVYLGGKSFNARKFAHNLSNEELARAVSTAHLFGVKIYVTVNILMADREMKELAKYLAYLDRIQVDGIIVQDLAVARLAQQVAPHLPLHGSTQMTVADLDGVRFLASLGFTQAVLSRELSAKEIAAVCQKSPIPIEIFMHGASCMSYSGQCLMSSFLGGRSGNRGACAQPCRQPYTLLENGQPVMKKEAYVLSLKDLCSLPYMDELLDAGVTSFKIEGRMKGDTYDRLTVAAYRKVMDAHKGGRNERLKAQAEAKKLLTSAFNRTFQADFLGGCLSRQTLTEKNPSGKQQAEEAAPGLTTRKIPIYAYVDAAEQGNLRLTLWDEKGHTAAVTSEFLPQPALKRPATADYLKNQLSRLGDTPFTLAELTTWDETKMIPASILNSLRRDTVAALAKDILKTYPRPQAGRYPQWPEKETAAYTVMKPELAVRCDSLAALQAAAEAGADCLIFGGESYTHHYFTEKDYRAAVQTAKKYGAALWAATPRIVREKDRPLIAKELQAAAAAGVDGMYAGAMAIFTLVQDLGLDLPLRADWSLNIFNEQAAKMYIGLGCQGITVSVEATLAQSRQLAARLPVPVEVLVQGRLEMMDTESCVISSFAGSGKKAACPAVCRRGAFSLRDRKGEDFPVVTDQYCRNHLLNSRDLDMTPYYKDLLQVNLAILRIEGRGRQPQWLIETVRRYRDLIDGKEKMILGKENQHVTRGHFFHGIL